MSVISAILVCAGLLGCSQSPNRFACATSDQCVRGTESGTCVQGGCAFADPACDGGLRFDPSAGGTCVIGDAGVPDAPICGAVGEACCATATACNAGATCDNGTCAACTTDVALGRRFGCMLGRDHHVRCAGDNANGELGTGLAGVASATPMEVTVATIPIDDATGVAARRAHACAIRTGGEVWCWGNNNVGQSGTPASGPVTNPVRVMTSATVPLANVVQIEAGRDFTCARDGSGGTWCWGGNGSGALGDGTLAPRSLAAPVLVAPAGAPFAGAVALAVGDGHACLGEANGELWCWGQNNNGQLGDSSMTNRPSPVMTATSTTSFAAGQYHTCFVNADTTVSCVGWGAFSRLGLDNGLAGYNDGSYAMPQPVLAAVATPFTGAAKVFAGAVSCAITTGGALACWGDSRYGQTGLGHGAVVPELLSIDHVDRVVAHYAHACARRTTGEWSCWGRNSEGAFGDGTFENRGLPTPLEVGCR